MKLKSTAVLLCCLLIACGDDDGPAADAGRDVESDTAAMDTGDDTPAMDTGRDVATDVPADVPTDAPPQNESAIVIKHGWDLPNVGRLSRADFVTEINESPFDGVVFSGGATTRVFGTADLSATDIADLMQVHADANFTRPMHNYFIMYVDSFGGFDDEAAVSRLVANARAFAQGAGDAGFEGILFDNEVYDGDPWTYSSGACDNAQTTFEACGEAAFNAGRRMMSAMIEVWPEARFMPLFGIWLDDPRTAPHIQSFAWAGDWDDPDDVDGNFLAGVFAATVGTNARYVDGGELYGLRTQDEFRQAAEWTTAGVAEDNQFIPAEFRAAYADTAMAGFGLYDGRDGLFASQVGNVTPSIYRDMLLAARPEADVIWVYTEIHDWWHDDGNPWPQEGARPGTEGLIDKDGEWYQAVVDGLAD